MGELPSLRFRPPVRLPGIHVELVPLSPTHRADLTEAGRAPEIWTYFRDRPQYFPGGMEGLIAELLRRQEAGTDLPFTILAGPERRPVGMTRFLGIDPANRSVEIGGTWIPPDLWGSPVNPESKYLLLKYAFEEEKVVRVQIKTDARNVHSQRAIEKLGAVREGVLRHHIRLPDGHLRDSVLYSILDSEWPAVRSRLEARLSLPWGSRAAPPS